MEKDYPYLTEYAKSSRSCCKVCKVCITKDSLRMAAMIQSPHFDGKIPHWYHFECFFKKIKINCFDDVKNIDTLRWEDQERIKNNLNTIVHEPSHDITIEYSKTNKSKCGGCEENINKKEIRISRMEYRSDKFKTFKTWYHINCFINLKNEISKETLFDIEKINGFDSLGEEDKSILSKKFKSWKSKKRPIKDSTSSPVIKKAKLENDLDKQLKEQNRLLWDVRDKLNNEVSKAALVHLLELNKQHVPIGEANLLNSVADCMVFGCLNACPECGGQLDYNSSRYKCQSMANEWMKCLYSTKEVLRSPFDIPEEYMDADILKNYKYKELNRILPPEAEKCSNIKPLKGYIVTIDQVNFPKEFGKTQMQKKIQELGGNWHKTLLTTSLVLISTAEGLETKKSYKCKAEQFQSDVVSVEFLLNVKNADLVETIKKYSLVNWGRSKDEIAALYSLGENKITFGNFVNDFYYLEKQFKKDSVDNVQILTIKGGAAVDPASDLTHKAHTYQDPKTKDPFNAILGMTDIVKGSNSFYKIQLLECDKFSKWWVFRSWGRIGTSIGNKKLELFHDLDSAIVNFCEIYLEKSGNEWENRNEFKKVPYKFVPIDIDYGEKAKNMEKFSNESSTLSPPVECLIRFIFDVESMKQAMLEFKIDLNKMPLGKLSQKQIDISYNILKELQDILINNNSTTTKLYELSNRFYTMMPHNFGMMAPPLIDSLLMVKKKSEMIESLMEIDVAFKLMEAEKGKNIIDSQYEKLHNNIIPLDKNSDEYKRLETYLQNTHAPTHLNYKIIIQDIFDISREGESNRYHSFRKLPNRMMLWHGSRRTNWAGILSQGLRIAPSEAPATGYMFGKGVYFADVVSKSANYCYTSSKSPDGILLLCEVALGKMAERFQADTNIVLKPGEHSCKGVGITIPDPVGNFEDKGIIYPMGKLVQQNVTSQLLYNEYIVYDVGQVKQRYLFKLKFIYE